jgi:arginine decarboxylase
LKNISQTAARKTRAKKVKLTYKHLMQENFDFPKLGFSEKKNELYFHGIRIMDLVEKFGTPMKITYLPKISEQIQRAQELFKKGIRKHKYKGNYFYCYCTKSSHFSFVMEEVFKNKVNIETSSAFDFEIIHKLHKQKYINKNTYVISNGFKPKDYLQRIVDLNNDGFRNVICVLDNKDEADQIDAINKKPLKIGFRLAITEHPNSDIYMSRLGIKSTEVIDFYKNKIHDHPHFKLKMIHFFINKGISDTVYYWNELERLIHTYCDLKLLSPDLDSINIGGGLKIHESIGEEIPYEYLISEIVATIQKTCQERNVPEPNIFSEFGSHTVGESGAVIYEIIGQKQQNEFERWYTIDSSFITTLPDIWGIEQKFILLPINQWDKEYTRVHLGGITCDGLDYYSSEKNVSEILLPAVSDEEKLYVGFFHTGAYQESLGGYGGIQHCLIPAPKHILISLRNNKPVFEVFADQQDARSMLRILGY